MTTNSREYQRAYYLAHRERILERTRRTSLAWNRAHPKYVAEANKKYHIKNAVKIAARKKAALALTVDARRAYAKEYHIKNAVRRNAASRQWYWANQTEVLERKKLWSRENPHLCVAQVAKRNARKRNATPKWADQDKMLAVYAEAARLTREIGVKHEVDHIIPLQGRMVCGLHCEANLQILTESANRSKHNKLVLE